MELRMAGYNNYLLHTFKFWVTHSLALLYSAWHSYSSLTLQSGGQIILLWSKFSCCLYVYACYVVDSSIYMYPGPDTWMHKHVCTSIPYTGSSTKHHHRTLSKSAGVSNTNSPLAMEMSGDFYRSNLVWLSVFILHILPLKCMVKNSFLFQLKTHKGHACMSSKYLAVSISMWLLLSS